jgi:cell wall-associated NlpC family hydrolase
MKQRLLLLFAVFLLVTTAVSADEINAVGEVTADALNVRSQPSESGEIIGTLKTGEIVNIITKTGGKWFKVDYMGKIGYACSDYISAQRDAEPLESVTVTTQSLEGMEKGQQVVEYAKQFLGVPYVWGGTSPSGFDCSGLVYYVYKHFGVTLNRVAAAMAENGTAVDLSALQPGDIVLFHNRAKYSQINHVGIYAGNGLFIHAPQTGDVVKFSTLTSGYYSTTLVQARRIFE